MSYCRIGEDSDVYLLCDGEGWQIILPYEKQLGGIQCLWHKTRKETLETLAMLQKNGYKVPDRAIQRLEKEIKESTRT